MERCKCPSSCWADFGEGSWISCWFIFWFQASAIIYQQIVTFTEASTSASSGRRATLPPSAEPGGPEVYLQRMQMVGEAHQEQLEILQQHWNLMQDFEKGKLESFQQEHAMLKQKQLHLLQEVQSQLQEMSNEPTCKRKVHDVTFGNSVSAPQPRGSYRVLVMGAGQLGREVCKNFKLPKWEVQNLEFDADLRMFEAQMTEFQPQVVLNLLGTELADRLSFRNFGAKTIAMATACDAHGVWLIHLSSDMVFDGTAPPYTVNAEPNPVTEAFDFRMRFTFDYLWIFCSFTSSSHTSCIVLLQDGCQIPLWAWGYKALPPQI